MAAKTLISASELRAEANAIAAASSSAAGGAEGVAASGSSSNSAAAGGREKPKFPALNAAAIGVSTRRLESVFAALSGCMAQRLPLSDARFYILR